jgi:UPF0755 protein
MTKRALKYWVKNFIIVHVATLMIIFPLFSDLIHRPMHIEKKDVFIDVTPGTSVKTLADALYEKGLLRHPRALEWYTRLTFQDKDIRAGEYRIPAYASIADLIKLVRFGSPYMHQIRFIEGMTMRQIVQIIQNDTALKHTINFSDPAWFRRLTKRYDNPEGLLMPDTYLFAKWETDEALIHRAYVTMQKTLDEAWAKRTPGLPYTDPYTALIAASIIEKETAIPEERYMISGVIVRRLEQHMRLQMDPTVIYGLADLYNGNITKSALTYPSPYNTYVNFGLPPTPICMPSKASILAAVAPAPGTSLYFVATGSEGRHQFSDSLQDHNKAVVEYAIPPAKQESAWQPKKGTTSSSP